MGERRDVALELPSGKAVQDRVAARASSWVLLLVLAAVLLGLGAGATSRPSWTCRSPCQLLALCLRVTHQRTCLYAARGTCFVERLLFLSELLLPVLLSVAESFPHRATHGTSFVPAAMVV
jgi:hypothetical protein